LEIARKQAQTFVVGKYGAGGIAANLIVPEADEREQDGKVFVQFGGAEMRVHRLPPPQESVESL